MDPMHRGMDAQTDKPGQQLNFLQRKMKIFAILAIVMVVFTNRLGPFKQCHKNSKHKEEF